jgi:hypothetical protein
MGRVKMPSTTALVLGPSFKTFLAAKIPRKKQTKVATTPVFREIHRGLQSRFETISMISDIGSRSILKRPAGNMLGGPL